MRDTGVATAPDDTHLGLLEGVPFRPVFIVGTARSGTTILYRLLAMTERFNCVTAYHLTGYDALLCHHVQGTTDQAKQRLNDRFRDLGIAGTRFDGVAVSPDFPEEYGFHLGHRQQLTPATLPRFIELCRKVQLTSAPERPLLLKNPWDSRSFLYIKRVLPDSRFIFIHRDPVDVVHSLLDGMRSLLGSRNAYHALLAESYGRLMERPVQRFLARLMFSPRLRVGANVVAWQVARTARYVADNIGSLPTKDYVSVRYEDLCQDPATAVNRVLGFVGLPENPAINYRDFIRVRQRRRLPADEKAVVRRLKLGRG